MNNIWATLVSLLCITASALAQQQPPARPPQPAPEMQSLAKAFEGKWRIREKYEPDEWTPNGGVGYGEEVWRRGPGGFTFMEEVHDMGPTTESFGLALAWWDKDKGFQGIWCENHNPHGCDLSAGSNLKWDGKQQIVDNEFQRNGKTFRWHEVLTDITPTSFVQTADIGEKGGPLKRWLTIHATKIAEGHNAERAQKLMMPGPDIQNLMLGTWVINVKYPTRSEKSSGDTGVGTELWRAGPGGRSVIEEYREKNAKGDAEGLGVAWWDKQAQGQRFVWCDNSNPDGCYVSKEVAKWEGESLVWREEQDKRVYSEMFKDISPDSFTQVLQEGEPGEPLKDMAIISAKRKAQSSMSSGHDTDVGQPETSGTEAKVETPLSAPAEAELRAVIADRRKASIEGDVETIASSMADDYVQTDIYGYRQDKTAWLDEYFRPLAKLIKTGEFRWELYDQKDLQFRLYGDCAVVTGNLEAKGTGARPGPQHTWVADPNASFGGRLHFTHVYIKRNGRWLLAALHNQLPPSSRNSLEPQNVAPGISQVDADSVAAQVIAAEDRYTQAYLHRDWAAASALLAPDYYGNAEGFEGDRAKLEHEFPNIHLFHYEVVSTPHLKLLAPNIVLYNDVATMRETYGERDISGRYWHGDIWVRRDGRWLLLVEQEVWLREPATASPNRSK